MLEEYQNLSTTQPLYPSLKQSISTSDIWAAVPGCSMKLDQVPKGAGGEGGLGSQIAVCWKGRFNLRKT